MAKRINKNSLLNNKRKVKKDKDNIDIPFSSINANVFEGLADEAAAAKQAKTSAAINKGLSVAGGALGLVSDAINQAKLDDTSEVENTIDSIANTKFVGDNDDLMSQFANVEQVGEINARKATWGQDFMAAGKSALSGASTGLSVGGPWGAAIGAVVGLGSSLAGTLVGRKKAKEKEMELREEAELAETTMLNNFDNAVENASIEKQADLQRQVMGNVAANGGPLNMRYTGTMSPFGNRFNDGGHMFNEYSNKVTTIDNGGTHEENPFEGVQVGTDPKGIPNLVEEGEVIYEDYVYSDRLTMPKQVRNKYKLRGTTFADGAKEVQKESEERPFDPISQNYLSTMMPILASSQEEVRAKKVGANPNEIKPNQMVNVAACGGRIANKFTGTKPKKLTLSEKAAMEEYGIEIPETEDSEISPIQDNYLRYAPIFGSVLAVGNDLLGGNEPEYSNVNSAINKVRDSYTPVTPKYLNNYLTYRPFDTEYAANKYKAQQAATRRNIMNTSGGNSAAARASLLAADYNASNELGDLYAKAAEYNEAQRQKVAEYNNAINQYNSEASMKAQMTNQSNLMQRANSLADLYLKRQAILDANVAEKSANLTNLFDNLGNLGREKYDKNKIQWLAENGVIKVSANGEIVVDEDTLNKVNKGALGGSIKKRKKKGITL